jgi:hypothetical protein
LDWYISSWCGFAVVVLPDSEKCWRDGPS